MIATNIHLSLRKVWAMFFYTLFFAGIVMLASCKRDDVFTSSDAILDFSVDTLYFDTVFTQQGTSTRWFKVYNPHNKAITISNIRLAGGAASDFNINIDGVSATEQSEVLLRPNDSMYIFVAARIDPSVGDALRMDSIYFNINGNQQKVYLQAYGWNATYLGGIGDTTFYVDTTVVLSGARPYFIAGWHIFVNSTLRIEAGTKLYMYGGPTPRVSERAMLYFGDNATIEIGINGSFQNPVIIQTHRLEEDFQDFPYHHDGIYLTANSRNNRIHNCIIRNATDAIRVDSLSTNGNPKLELRNTFIYNVERSGILARQGSITAENTIIANANQYALVLLRGGDYDFTHCTFVNYATTTYLRRREPVLSLRDYEVLPDENILVANGNANFTNCIIYGTRAEELEVEQVLGSTATLNVLFDHCLVKRDTFNRYLQDCISNEDPAFENKEEYDYSLDSLTSPAYRTGKPTSITNDILGIGRSSSTPDIGAYEWQP